MNNFFVKTQVLGLFSVTSLLSISGGQRIISKFLVLILPGEVIFDWPLTLLKEAEISGNDQNSSAFSSTKVKLSTLLNKKLNKLKKYKKQFYQK